MIYNFNLGIGWASSGVEYAQSYRANIFRRLGAKAKFIFTDMFVRDNIEELTANIGFADDEIIWLYTFFTDQKIAPCTYTLEDIIRQTDGRDYTLTDTGDVKKIIFEDKGDFWSIYMSKADTGKVHRVEIVSRGCLIRKDFYTYTRVFSEYYTPKEGKAHLYQRRFFNEDGTVGYDEIIDGEDVFYRFKDRIIYSKEELVGYMVSGLKIKNGDIILIDRSTTIGQPILENKGEAKVGIIIHADHFSEGATNDDYILWNNYYEYAFANYGAVDFYVAATDAQNILLRDQFKKYLGFEPAVATIPVGSIDEFKAPAAGRKSHALITASRLASEKHIDLLIEAVALAKDFVPDLTLDIYGKGGEEDKLKKLIEKLGAGEYIHLMGQQDLKEVYKEYFAYVSASLSEGFGLTYLEAIGSGLPIVGYDVRYGMRCFGEHDKNGYKLPVSDDMGMAEKTDKLARTIIRLCCTEKIEQFRRRSYEIAAGYLTVEVEKKWKELIEWAI